MTNALNRLSRCRNWIFDMDGTLTLAAHNFDDIRQALQIDAGTPILEAIAAMPPSRADATRRHLHAIEMEIAHQSKPQPDAATTLASLQQRGFKLGILTRNAEDIAAATLSAAGLSQFFYQRRSNRPRQLCTKTRPRRHFPVTQSLAGRRHAERNGWRLSIRS